MPTRTMARRAPCGTAFVAHGRLGLVVGTWSYPRGQSSDRYTDSVGTDPRSDESADGYLVIFASPLGFARCQRLDFDPDGIDDWVQRASIASSAIGKEPTT